MLGCAGVLLLLWAPAKRAARSGDGRAEFAAAAAQEYAAKCEEILSQAGPADAEVPPCLKFHSWRCFLGRWRAALTAATAQAGSAHEEVGAQACARTLATVLTLLSHKRHPRDSADGQSGMMLSVRALQLTASKEMSSENCCPYWCQECMLSRGSQGRRVDGQEIMHQTCAQIWDIIKASLSGSGPETCQAAQAAAALHGLTATSDLQLSRAIQAALQELSRTGRCAIHVHC